MNQTVTRHRPAPPAGGVVGLVAFLFGISGREALPGVALRRLLGDLGMSDAAARAAISRMCRAGRLATERQGRQASYRLAGPTARGFAFIRNRGSAPPAWDGSLHTVLYRVPESGRPFRDALRREARIAGYGVLQSGVLVAPGDYRDQLADVLGSRPPDAHVLFGRLTLEPDDAAQVIATAWDLDALADGYRAHIETLGAVLGTAVEDDGADALRAFATTVSPALVATLGEPAVPPGLLPADWPGPELRRLVSACGEHLGPPAGRHVAETLRASN